MPSSSQWLTAPHNEQYVSLKVNILSELISFEKRQMGTEKQSERERKSERKITYSEYAFIVMTVLRREKHKGCQGKL